MRDMDSLAKHYDSPKMRNGGSGKSITLYKFKKHWQLYIVISVPVIYMLIFNYLPMVGLQLAFKDFSIRKGLFGSPWVGLKYFKQFLNTYSFWSIVKNTLSISVYTWLSAFRFRSYSHYH